MKKTWYTSLPLLIVMPLIAAAQPPAEESEPALLAESIGLVQQLGDEEFATRERATNRLIEIGLPARSPLERGSDHPDREIRYRCERILGIVLELDFQRRLTAFATGRSDGTDLPAWNRFRELFGDDGESRAMFVEIQKAEGELMVTVENGPDGVAAMINSRCAELQLTQRSAGRPISLGNIMGLLFAVLDDELTLNFQTSSNLCNFCSQPPMNDAMNDPSKQKFVRRVLGSWIKRSEGWTAYQTMALAMQYGLEEGLVPAARVLKNPGEQPFVRQNAILAVAKLGGERHVELLEELLEDTARCSAQRINNVTYETQVRDVALAAILIIRDQDPKKFGFNRIQLNDTNVFITSTVGFENEDKRKKVFDKYKKPEAGSGKAE